MNVKDIGTGPRNSLLLDCVQWFFQDTVFGFVSVLKHSVSTQCNIIKRTYSELQKLVDVDFFNKVKLVKA